MSLIRSVLRPVIRPALRSVLGGKFGGVSIPVALGAVTAWSFDEAPALNASGLPASTGEAVATLPDLTENGNDFTQADVAKRYTLDARGAIVGDGVDDRVQSPEITRTDADRWEMSVVVRYDSAFVSSGVFFAWSGEAVPIVALTHSAGGVLGFMGAGYSETTTGFPVALGVFVHYRVCYLGAGQCEVFANDVSLGVFGGATVGTYSEPLLVITDDGAAATVLAVAAFTKPLAGAEVAELNAWAAERIANYS